MQNTKVCVVILISRHMHKYEYVEGVNWDNGMIWVMARVRFAMMFLRIIIFCVGVVHHIKQILYILTIDTGSTCSIVSYIIFQQIWTMRKGGICTQCIYVWTTRWSWCNCFWRFSHCDKETFIFNNPILYYLNKTFQAYDRLPSLYIQKY